MFIWIKKDSTENDHRQIWRWFYNAITVGGNLMKKIEALIESIKGIATEKQGDGDRKEVVIINGKEV